MSKNFKVLREGIEVGAIDRSTAKLISMSEKDMIVARRCVCDLTGCEHPTSSEDSALH